MTENKKMKLFFHDLHPFIATHLFDFETTRRSLYFPTGRNGGTTEASVRYMNMYFLPLKYNVQYPY